MENKKKTGLFGRRQNRPDALPEDTTPTLGFFFKLLWRKLGKLVSLNLMMIFQYLPIIIAAIVYLFGQTISTVEEPLYAPLLGVTIAGGSPTTNLLAGIFSRQLDIPFLTPWRTVVIIILALFTVITWGWQNVGSTYNLRSLIRGDSCFLISDYFYAVKRNFKQAFFFGLLDIAVIFTLVCDYLYFSQIADVFLFGVMYVIFVVLAIVYSVMRFYIYHMMITFDLSIKKLLKNALIFVVLGIKRNLLALLGIAAVIGINLLLIVPGFRVGFLIPIVLPLFYLPALLGFIAGYASWPIIQRYMIDPYQTKEAPENEEESTEDDAILPPEEC